MNGYMPIGGAIIFISLYFFYEMNRVRRNKKIDRQEERRARQEENIRLIKDKRQSEGSDFKSGTNDQQ